MKKFGATVRELRLDKGITLRKFAEAVGISPTFQSRIERDELPPPARDTIVRMARALGEDEDRLLGLAGKVAADLPEIVQERPLLMATFLRRAGRLSDDSIKKLMKQMEKLEKFEKAIISRQIPAEPHTPRVRSGTKHR